VSIHGHVPEDSRSLLAERLPSLDQLDLLVRADGASGCIDARTSTRRSSSVFSRPWSAPDGHQWPASSTFTVIRDRVVLEVLRERVIAGLGDAIGGRTALGA